MKRILTTFIFLIFTQLAFSQSTTWLPSRIESSYEDPFLGTYQYTGTYSYNASGLLVEFANRVVTSESAGGYTYKYDYDNYGREIHYSRWGSDCGVGASSYSFDSINKSYNDEGLLSCKMQGTRIYPDWEFSWRSKTEYHYDDLGRCVLVETFGNPDNWTLKKRVIYEYYDNGIQVEIGNEYQKIRQFDAEGNLVDFVVKTMTEHGLCNNTHTAYEYQDGLLHETLQQVWSAENGVWINETQETNVFDDQGFLIEQVKLDWDDALGQFVNVIKAVYENDAQGRCQSMQKYVWTDGEWVSADGYVDADVTLFFSKDLNLEDQLARADAARYLPSAIVQWEEYMVPNFVSTGLLSSEWYYEIQDDDGSVTYQHLEYAADTTVNDQKAKVLVRTNHIYDKQIRDVVSREVVFEEDDIVYWWNAELQQFTVLYDFAAVEGDSWTIQVGRENLVVHVVAEGQYEYEGNTYRMLHVSDEQGLFNGDIVCGIGHLTSFFPERLMTQAKGYRVEGIRCCWDEGNLVFKIGDRDCDEVYERYHHGVDEPVVESIKVYPNPTTGVLHIETPHPTDYRITNLLGQTVKSGRVTADGQQISIHDLSDGMYFITVGSRTQKIIINKIQ